MCVWHRSADAVFSWLVQERIRFADERTKEMNWYNYDAFARGRKLNFMSSKGQQFRHWLRIGKSSRASLEFLNFVAYHKCVSVDRVLPWAYVHIADVRGWSLECATVWLSNSIGRLVELAIKNRAGGVLQALATPLVKSDIQYVSFVIASVE